MKAIKTGHVHYGRPMPDTIVGYSSIKDFVKKCSESNWDYIALYRTAYFGKYESTYKTYIFSGAGTNWSEKTISADVYTMEYYDDHGRRIHPVTLYMLVHAERKKLNPVWLWSWRYRSNRRWRRNFSSSKNRYPATKNEMRARVALDTDREDLEEIGYKSTLIKQRGRFLPTAYDDLGFCFSNGWKAHRKTQYRMTKPRKNAA